jgi:hypothetical protein
MKIKSLFEIGHWLPALESLEKNTHLSKKNYCVKSSQKDKKYIKPQPQKHKIHFIDQPPTTLK